MTRPTTTKPSSSHGTAEELRLVHDTLSAAPGRRLTFGELRQKTGLESRPLRRLLTTLRTRSLVKQIGLGWWFAHIPWRKDRIDPSMAACLGVSSEETAQAWLQRERDILDLLAKAPPDGVSVARVADRLHLTRRQVYRVLYRLQQEGRVHSPILGLWCAGSAGNDEGTP